MSDEEISTFHDTYAKSCKEKDCVLLNFDQKAGVFFCDIAGIYVGQLDTNLPFANKNNVLPDCPQNFYDQIK